MNPPPDTTSHGRDRACDRRRQTASASAQLRPYPENPHGPQAATSGTGTVTADHQAASASATRPTTRRAA
ncbi:hypothetical protein ACIBW9_09465 [Streptomyces sp. NPDC049541]|uniref:hypothetical protein n=1 Tax=Streptomyces sp. NPDC049541 TaxID=3365594 RepID=UPI0037911385